MSLRVVREGTMQIRYFSDNYLPPSSLNAGNGIWIKQRSGTTISSGSSSRSATGLINTLCYKEKLDSEFPLSSSSSSISLKASRHCKSVKNPSSQSPLGAKLNNRKLLANKSSTDLPGTLVLTSFSSTIILWK